MDTTTPIQEHPFRLAHSLAIVGVAFALVLSVLAIHAMTSTGLVTRTLTVETETLHVVEEYSPLKFVPPSPRPHRAE
jgi:hypothetical protein